MKYKNKYFKKLNYENSCTQSLFYSTLKNDKRNKKWKKQRKNHGNWDERTVWNLNTFMTEQIYTWLKLYFEKADNFVDLTFYKFEINNTEMTERDAILLAISDIEFYLVNLGSMEPEIIKKSSEKISEAYTIIGIVLPTLWY